MTRFLFLCTVLLLTACGPRYQTVYDLTPPSTAAGRECAANCALTSERCQKECYRSALQCEAYNEMDRYSTIGTVGYDGGFHTGIGARIYPLDRACPTGGCIEACMQQANACHIGCGGAVTERVICTANCPAP